MKEDFLHYLWRHRAWDAGKPRGTEGELITVQHPGLYNRDGGPDFQDARIRIDGTLWAGAVEIHIRSSDWFRHGHHLDPNYNNVVLHVVWEADDVPCRTDGSPIPQLVLEPYVKPSMLERYKELSGSAERLPCMPLWDPGRDLALGFWYGRMLVERLEYKSQQLETGFLQAGSDWEEALYCWISRYLGGTVNADAMEALARQVPLKILRKYRGNRVQIEALLFGTAGLLPSDPGDDYTVALQSEAKALMRLHGLQCLAGPAFRFLRMRPVAFPTLRIALLAALVDHSEHLFSGWIRSGNSSGLYNTLMQLSVSSYWEEHYRFGIRQPHRNRNAGEELVQQLLINVVLPMKFFYAHRSGDLELCQQVLENYEQLPPENNRIMRVFEPSPMPNSHAADSQALYHLFHQYCRKRRCMECQIAATFLGRAC